MSETEEKSQLVEKVEEQSEQKSFDVNAFTEEIIEKPKTETEKVEDVQIEDGEDGEDGTWDSIVVENEKEEEEETEEQETEEDWDVEETVAEESTEESSETDEIDWGKVSKTLGLEAGTKEDFVKSVNEIINQQTPKPTEPTNDSINTLQDLIKLSDRELLAEEMKADGMDEYDIDESLDKMEDSGVMKRESTRIRRQLKTALKNEKQKVIQEKNQTEQERQQNLQQNKKDLQNHLKNVDSYFGGKVSKNEKKNLYKYITSGKFNDDIYASHSNVSEIAWMWRNKEKIKKILFSEGFEKGKAHIFNGITSPSTNRSSKPNLKIKTGKFDVGEFLKE